jgi:uncharacterized membrane protein
MKNWDFINKQISANQVGNIRIQSVVLLLLIAAALFVLFYSYKKYVVPYLGSRKEVSKAQVLRYRVEIAVWSTYAVFGVYQLLTDSLYITGVMLIIVILAFRNFWKDLFAGITFKIQNRFKENDPIRFENYSGIIEQIGTRNLLIKTDDEETIVVPFRRLSEGLLVKRQAKGKLYSGKIVLSIQGNSAEELLSEVSIWLQFCPWAVKSENNAVKLISSSEISITVFAIDLDSIANTEKYLKNCLKNHK